MPVIPNDRLDAIEFCETHLPVWEVAPGLIGLAPPVIAQFGALTGAARAKYEEALLARSAARAATAAYYAAERDLRTLAASMVRTVKAFAESQPKPAAVYTAAQIPQPRPHSPRPAPGKPTDFSVRLEPSGAITLSWKCASAAATSGVIFSVLRKLPGQAQFVSIGGSPGVTTRQRRASFIDDTLPAAAAARGVQYIVRGRRGTAIGPPSDAITVQFGAPTSPLPQATAITRNAPTGTANPNAAA